MSASDGQDMVGQAEALDLSFSRITEAVGAALKKNAELLEVIKTLQAKLDAQGDASAQAERDIQRPMNLQPIYPQPCVICGLGVETWITMDAARVYMCMPDWHAWRASTEYSRWLEYTKLALSNFATSTKPSKQSPP